MSLIRHTIFPRSYFDTDEWLRTPPTIYSSIPLPSLSTIEVFDPYDELDSMLSRNLQWFNRPTFLNEVPIQPRIPRKYRVTIDCSGFNADSIKTLVQPNNQLLVSAKEESHDQDTDDYYLREFKKTYQLPEGAQTEKLVSFSAGNRLIIEVPLSEQQKEVTDVQKPGEMFPKIVDNPDGSKSVTIQFNLPEGVDPSKAHVSIKDRDVIFRVEDKVRRPDSISRFHYYQRTTFPENAKFSDLKCTQDNQTVTVTAPIDLNYGRPYRRVPIEQTGQRQSQIETQGQPQLQEQNQPQTPGQTQAQSTEEIQPQSQGLDPTTPAQTERQNQ